MPVMTKKKKKLFEQNKRLGLLNPGEGSSLTDLEQQQILASIPKQERGVHGSYDPVTNQVHYGTTGQEGKNFLTATDRFHNRDAWGASPQMGPTGNEGLFDYTDESDPIIKKARDKQNAMLDAQMMDKGDVGEAEGRLSADAFQRTQGIYGEDELDQRGPTVDTEESALDRIGAENRGRAASMADFDDEEGGGFWNEALGLLRPDSIGKPEKKKYRDVDTEGDNRYLNKLAREEFEKKQAVYGMDDLNQRGPTVDTEGESALDRISAEDRGRTASLADFKGEEEGEPGSPFGGLRDAFSGAGDWLSEKFSSDDKEDVEGRKAFGKAMLGQASKKPTGGGGSRRMPEARTTAGRVAFPGLLNKPKRQKTPYFMPKGLV